MTTWARRYFARTPTRGERVVDAVEVLRRRARRLLDWMATVAGEMRLVDENKLAADDLATLVRELEARAGEIELRRRRDEMARLSEELAELGGAPDGIAVLSDDLPTLGAAIQRLKTEIERRRMGV